MKKRAASIKVKLRTKAITGSRKSLYLDFYPAIANTETGEPTRREFLGMYLYDAPRSPIDKLHNKETEALAQQIRQRREMELNKGEVYSMLEKQVLKQQQAEDDRGERTLLLISPPWQISAKHPITIIGFPHCTI